ncbi:MAG: prephenate dehydrogenase/arogenate dehydrogenase family protein [Hadesarchaea archaeon]|nr:prephenate dehydrogenase/arogenate dehydrogenase family protein [Hadesarchaea archaeon]MDH5685806.1 prephenate dehydrogenase/arogenate dehydrogenase family protein [Hadesarchaea archaeon]
MKVAVIGAGAMGQWLAGFVKQNLDEVVVADVSATKAERVAKELGISSKSVAEAAAEAELVLVAVPISKTPEVIKSLTGQVQRGVLIADITSVKSDVVEVMKTIEAKVELVSLHPLFGPGAASVKGKDFVVVPVKPGQRYAALKNRLIELGARVTEMDAEEHDRLMAITQCMTHFVLLVYLDALKSMKGLKQAEKLRTPMFATLLDLAKSVLAGNPELYGELQVRNRYARVVRSSLLEACRSLDIAFSAGDAKSVRAIFKEALAPWGSAKTKNAYKRMYERFEEGKT